LVQRGESVFTAFHLLHVLCLVIGHLWRRIPRVGLGIKGFLLESCLKWFLSSEGWGLVGLLLENYLVLTDLV
jgi:hypothetical protein